MSILQAVMTAPLMSSGGPPTYTLTPFFSGGPESVNEGSGLNFLVGGTNIPDGTYYWTIETNAGDFATASGTVSVTGTSGANLGVFGVTPTADATTEATAETFTVALREGSITGTILVTSVAVTINDTSFAIGGSLMIGASTRSWATTNATATTYGAYTYPDETSGSLHTLTGTQYVLSEGWGATSDISFNLWFYPTANDKLIIGELGQASEDSGYHYSVLEINSTNRLKGRVWEMSTFQAVTSTGTVNLNAWNHVYMYFNNTTSTLSMSLNNETAVTQGSVGRNIPTLSYWGIGLTDATNMGSGARYQGKFDALVIDSNIAQGSTYTGTKAKYLPSFGLEFVESQNDYVEVAASSDFNLGTTWTIEFWLRANASSLGAGGGIWGLLNQGGWGATNSIVVALSDAKLVFLSVANNSNDDVRYTEPTSGRWTHVAIVNTAGTQKVWYNGSEQTRVSGNVGTASYTNGTDPLRIGRLSPPNGGTLDGKMALVRISNTAKYSATFTPTVTYGVEADTKLFLNSVTPLTDASASAHTITNNGTAVSPTFVNRYTALHSAGSPGSSQVVIDSTPNNDAWAGNVPVGATIISQVTGRFTVTSLGREIGTNKWLFYVGGSNNFTGGETHTFIW